MLKKKEMLDSNEHDRADASPSRRMMITETTAAKRILFHHSHAQTVLVALYA